MGGGSGTGFPTRLAPHRQAVQEFITTRQGYRLATSTGGVLTGRGADIILIDDPLKPEEALSETQRQPNRYLRRPVGTALHAGFKKPASGVPPCPAARQRH